MNEIVDFKILNDFLLWIKFNDGFESEVDIKPLLGKGFTRELLVKKNFNNVFIEPGGGLAWENGFDICPNYLRQLAEETEEQEKVKP